MSDSLLISLLIIFSFSVLVVFVFHWIKIPSIVGFLLTGALIGPKAFALIDDIDHVETLAETGVVLLLFTIGMEFSFKRLNRIRKVVILGGGLQVSLTILAGLGLFTLFSPFAFSDNILLSFMLALSSTAIALTLFQAKGETQTAPGQASTGILIFQDLAIVPMMLVLPMLGAGTSTEHTDILAVLIKIVLVIAVIIVLAKIAVPQVLNQVAKTRNQELFIITIVLICMAVAYTTFLAGLSLALGAFLAGLMISESKYNHQALSQMSIFKDIFSSFFFVSIGMMMDLRFLDHHLLLVGGIALAVIILKSVVAGFVVLLMGYPLRTAIISGMAMSQIGEFAFVLIKSGDEIGLIGPPLSQYAIDASIVTMAATPLAMAIAPKLANLTDRLPLPRRILEGGGKYKPPAPEGAATLKDHLIIVGFGVTGRMLASTAKNSNLKFVVFDMNPDIVKTQSEKGLPIVFGDAARVGNLEAVNAKEAKVAVVAVSGPMSVRRIIVALRSVSPNLHIVVRARLFEEAQELAELGADEIIAEDYQSAIDIFSRVLAIYNIPEEQISHFIAQARIGGKYSAERYRSPSPDLNAITNFSPIMTGLDSRIFKVARHALAEGQTLGDLNLRSQYGVTVVVVRHHNENTLTPGADFRLSHGDLVLITGPKERIDKARALFEV